MRRLESDTDERRSEEEGSPANLLPREQKGKTLMAQASKMEVIGNWVAEFFIRHQTNPRVSPSNLLPALKLVDSSNCVKLKVSAVLRDISNSLSRGPIDEGTLDLLELLEKLMLEQHSTLIESHKSAYCWTAVECTLKFMWPSSASQGLLKDAVERIWTKRIGILKESESVLVTPELLKWETGFKKALENHELYQWIREANTRYIAGSFLTQFLKEQWELLGSSSLDSVVQRIFPKCKTQNVEGDIVDNRGDPNAVDENMMRLESDNDTIDNINELGGGKAEEDGDSGENANDVEGVECLEDDVMENVNEADEEQIVGAQEEEHQASPDDGNRMRSESDTDTIDNTIERRGEKEDEDGNSGENANDVEGVGCLENDVIENVNEADEEQIVGAQEEEHQASPDDENRMRSESDTDTIDNTIERRGEKEDEDGNSGENANDVEGVGCLENDVIENVNEADKEQIVGAEEEEHQTSLSEGDKTVAQELKDDLLEIHRQIDPSTRQGEESNNVIDQSVDVTPPPARVNKTGAGNQSHNEGPDSANEKGSDSQPTSSCRVRPRPSTPVSLNASPLKKESSHSRRQKNFWTPEEVEALKEGVKEYGKSWKDIKNANPAVFKERTEVDLKDKWRNLFR